MFGIDTTRNALTAILSALVTSDETPVSYVESGDIVWTPSGRCGIVRYVELSSFYSEEIDGVLRAHIAPLGGSVFPLAESELGKGFIAWNGTQYEKVDDLLVVGKAAR
jgi:hypothetical protein